MKPEITIYTVETVAGNAKKKLSFLNDEEFIEFNRLGAMCLDRTKFLNSLGKGEFKIHQTRFDNGDWGEEFIIVQVAL